MAQAQTPSTPPHAGGLLRVAIDTDPNCLDPQQVGNNNSLNIGRQVTDSLTDQRPDTGEIVPWLAERWSVSADSRTFTFTLRDGASFSDGTPVDAEAVKANLSAIVGLGARAALASTYLAGLTDIGTPDSRTVVISFAQPNVQFLQATSTMSLGLLAKTTLAKSPEERCQGQLIGSGPFTISSFVHNQIVKLGRRADYDWPSSLGAHQGAAYLDEIDYRVIPEAGVRNGSLLSRQIDVNTSVLPQDEQVLLARHLPIIARANPGLVYGLYPNEKDPVLGDVLVRRAINKGINRPELQAILSRYQAPASSVLAKTTPLVSDLRQALAFDPQGARALLEQDGWIAGSDGVRVKNGQRLAFKLPYWQATPFLELVQQQLRAIGLDLQLNHITISQVTALQASGTMAIQFYNLTRADPDILRTVFDANGRNVNRRSPGAVDAILAQSSAALDPVQRAALIAQAATALIADGHAIPLVELSTVIATGIGVHGLHYEASSRLQFFDTWIEP